MQLRDAVSPQREHTGCQRCSYPLTSTMDLENPDTYSVWVNRAPGNSRRPCRISFAQAGVVGLFARVEGRRHAHLSLNVCGQHVHVQRLAVPGGSNRTRAERDATV